MLSVAIFHVAGIAFLVSPAIHVQRGTQTPEDHNAVVFIAEQTTRNVEPIP